MKQSPTLRTLSRSDWVRRCAAAIRGIDDVVTLIDAADLASTLHDLPCCSELAPETAAARLFCDALAPPPRVDLSALREQRRPAAKGTAA